MIHCLLVVLTAERATYTKRYIPSLIIEHGGGLRFYQGVCFVVSVVETTEVKSRKSVHYCNKIPVGDGEGSASRQDFGVTSTFLGIPGMRYIENSGVNSAPRERQ
ncbi:hypothetical protein AVEN_210230-1 [Araneus ventricosus]|uniref:Uncharacterized protein n=1 Tax=Araneus ventricosus TaxID=182803 RepID=A0A4Y2FYJ2_ARAVE|nr:hypothetical protein AVEN_210230-1 [Araneus ventricosus]